MQGLLFLPCVWGAVLGAPPKSSSQMLEHAAIHEGRALGPGIWTVENNAQLPIKEPPAVQALYRGDPSQMNRLQLIDWSTHQPHPEMCDATINDLDEGRGHHAHFAAGWHNNDAVRQRGFHNRSAASVKVVGHYCKVLIWPGANFSGEWRMEFTEGEYGTADVIARGGDTANFVGSVKVLNCAQSPEECADDPTKPHPPLSPAPPGKPKWRPAEYGNGLNLLETKQQRCKALTSKLSKGDLQEFTIGLAGEIIAPNGQRVVSGPGGDPILDADGKLIYCRNGTYALGSGVCYGEEKTYEAAKGYCQTDGKRLCTKAELNAKMCCGSGCDYNFKRVWTSDNCGNNPYNTIYNDSFWMVDGCKGNKLAGKNNSKQGDFDELPDFCAGPQEVAAVRCCEDASPVVCYSKAGGVDGSTIFSSQNANGSVSINASSASGFFDSPVCNAIKWWDVVPDDCPFKDQAFKFTRQKVWREFSDLSTHTKSGEIPDKTNCQSVRKCGGKLDMCYYSVPKVGDIFQYDTYGWPVAQNSTFLGNVDVLNNRGYGSSGAWHTRSNTVWGHPSSGSYTEVQGFVMYPLAGLNYSKAPGLTINIEFVPAKRSELMTQGRWGKSFVRSAIEWVLIYSADGGTHNDYGTNLKQLARGSFLVMKDGSLENMIRPEDIKISGLRVDCFDTGHVALWMRNVHADDTSGNATMPLVAVGDNHEFIFTDADLDHLNVKDTMDITSSSANCFVGNFDSIDLPTVAPLNNKDKLKAALFDMLDWM